jgi:hypothetical protein
MPRDFTPQELAAWVALQPPKLPCGRPPTAEQIAQRRRLKAREKEFVGQLCVAVGAGEVAEVDPRHLRRRLQQAAVAHRQSQRKVAQQEQGARVAQPEPEAEAAGLSIGSRKHAKWAAVFAAAEELHSAVQTLATRVLEVHPADWFAAYVLLCLTEVFPGGFIGGKIELEVVGDAAAFPCSQVRWRAPGCVAGASAGEVGTEGDLHRNISSGSGGGAYTLLLRDVGGLSLAARDLTKVGGEGTPVLDVLRE